MDFLYRKRIDPGTDREVMQLVLPTSGRDYALAHLHIGHLGIDKTLQLIREHYSWPKMADDVKMKVQTCPACVRRKTTPNQRAPLVSIETAQPMELVSIDYLMT